MGRTKGPHHRGTYHRRSLAIVTAARSNPATRCWRCGRTLTEHPPHHNGRPPFWTAGHIIDGQVNGELRPEASTCNYSAGARRRNHQPSQHPYR